MDNKAKNTSHIGSFSSGSGRNNDKSTKSERVDYKQGTNLSQGYNGSVTQPIRSGATHKHFNGGLKAIPAGQAKP